MNGSARSGALGVGLLFLLPKAARRQDPDGGGRYRAFAERVLVRDADEDEAAFLDVTGLGLFRLAAAEAAALGDLGVLGDFDREGLGLLLGLVFGLLLAEVGLLDRDRARAVILDVRLGHLAEHARATLALALALALGIRLGGEGGQHGH